MVLLPQPLMCVLSCLVCGAEIDYRASHRLGPGPLSSLFLTQQAEHHLEILG